MEESSFKKLAEIIAKRKEADQEESYTAKLLKAPLKNLLKKVGEEAVEVVIAAGVEDKQAVIYESCDLIYHLMVLWEREKISLVDIEDELARRFTMSGLAEKKSRDLKH